MNLRRFRHASILTVILIGLLLPGCTDIPELDATVPRHLEKADYPELAPIDTILLPLPAPQKQSETLQKQLEYRRDSLQNRASRLNTPVVDEETHVRMQTGVTR